MLLFVPPKSFICIVITCTALYFCKQVGIVVVKNINNYNDTYALSTMPCSCMKMFMVRERGAPNGFQIKYMLIFGIFVNCKEEVFSAIRILI